MSKPKTLSIIGCGKVGQTLARLWVQHHTVRIQDILNTSIESGTRAAAFVGAGRAANSYADLQAADIFLIAASDDCIVNCCEALSRTNCLSANSIVFHCSGALSSSVLQSASDHGAAVASIHPIRSFAAPEKVVADFSGTYCGVEGDQRAIAVLSEAFTAIGGEFVPIQRDAKVLYHAAAVFASNYLVTLLDTAVQTYGKAGIPEDTALKMMAALVRETSENVLQLGTEQALTGPIARDDAATVVTQYRAVNRWNRRYGALYKQLGKLTAHLARRRKIK
ncbi:conserved hypothetical protein; putative NAD(P)-binding Rossmann-fold domain [Herminiimonas arsenicoxydans]|uniref:DUF2520 domain-containing protein n=1 Tax=Herminiimonas arsenicoxydans TaxID=204773 RepID=A4G4Q4_HERAR|nr:conserved hypothetical protein; putative NAD(P)-binding Rossmann-fold domain [Herminiimonas arsenicoxydans]